MFFLSRVVGGPSLKQTCWAGADKAEAGEAERWLLCVAGKLFCL